MTTPFMPPVGDRDDLGAVLHEEIGRLPRKYREPVVLCYLEGKTNAEAARELGCPVGTVKINLLRARERLRSRLDRRGLGLAVFLLLAFLQDDASASMPEGLAVSTVGAAVRARASRPPRATSPVPASRTRRLVISGLFLLFFVAWIAPVGADGKRPWKIAAELVVSLFDSPMQACH